MRRQFGAAAAVVCLFSFMFASRPVRAAEEKAKAGTDAAAQKAKCDAKCRQDYQGNAADIDACIRNCGAAGPAAKFHGNTLNQSTTVKSSKSNTSERAVHAGVKDPTPAEARNLNSSKSNADREEAPSGSGAQPAETSSVKSSKSNSSDRVAAPAGPASGTIETTTTLNASKSNNYRAASSSTSGTVTNVDAAGKTISLKRKDGSIIVMDSSRLKGGLPKIGQAVSVAYSDVGGKPTVVSIAVSDPGVPNK